MKPSHVSQMTKVTVCDDCAQLMRERFVTVFGDDSDANFLWLFIRESLTFARFLAAGLGLGLHTGRLIPTYVQYLMHFTAVYTVSANRCVHCRWQCRCSSRVTLNCLKNTWHAVVNSRRRSCSSSIIWLTTSLILMLLSGVCLDIVLVVIDSKEFGSGLAYAVRPTAIKLK